MNLLQVRTDAVKIDMQWADLKDMHKEHLAKLEAFLMHPKIHKLSNAKACNWPQVAFDVMNGRHNFGQIGFSA